MTMTNANVLFAKASQLASPTLFSAACDDQRNAPALPRPALPFRKEPSKVKAAA